MGTELPQKEQTKRVAGAREHLNRRRNNEMLPPVRSRPVRAGVGAVGLAILTLAGSACTTGSESEEVATSTVTTVSAQEPVTRPSCVTEVPASWQAAIEDSAVDTGGVSNVPLAVGRRGEVAVARDNGDTRDLLVVAADKSVAEVYPVPEPDKNRIGPVAIDDRWVVVGVAHAPRDANGVLPTLIRIDVVDRQGGAIRNVAESTAEDQTAGGKTIDSVALFGGKVYWITRDTYAGDTGTIRSFDLNTGAVTDVASGEMRNVRATAAGLSWEVAWDQNAGTRTELKIPDALPPPVAGAVGTGRDQLTLATDGNVYAWLTESGGDTEGLAYWSPGAGLVRITGNIPPVDKHQMTPVYVVGPYVLLGTGRPDNSGETNTTVIDTRSGALVYLAPTVGGADGGTIAVGLGATMKALPTSVGVVRVDALPRLSC
ncbi:hypothetical protein A5662_18220 [Mycobacteriaceae bacterium 1482268.1]|nr:hypothetical protein A5662_18220 [Mycobacteriaceae bacterium 1482268.1]